MQVKRSFPALLIILGLALVLSASGLTYAESRKADDKLIAEGWAQARGEVRIYLRQENLGKLFDGSCISGTMSGGRTMPSNLQNQHVAVYGTLVDKSAFDEMSAHLETIGVENYCSSKEIAIITRIIPIRKR